MDYLSGFAPNVEIPVEKSEVEIKVVHKKVFKDPELFIKDDGMEFTNSSNKLRENKSKLTYHYEKSSPKGT